MPNKKSKVQKIYKMRGCAKKTKKNLHKKSGGSAKLSNVNLSYPTHNIFSISNPNLAYTGKGGNNPIYPNTGPTGPYPGWINSSIIRGGGCGCGTGPINVPQNPTQNGGTCSLCNAKMIWGGEKKHTSNCLCSLCKNKQQNGGNNGLPYGQNLPPMKDPSFPHGTIGKPWEPNYGWPGVSNSNNYNHYSMNKYIPDVQLQIKNVGAQPPYLGGSKRTKILKTKKNKKGGGSNGFSQDFVNLGRQFTHGLGSAYNSLRGFHSPTNPMPWNGQLSKTPDLNTIKNNYT